MRTSVEFAKLLSTLAVEFINMSPDEIGPGVDRALKQMGEYARADRSYVFLFSEDGNKMSNLFEWAARGISPEIDNLQDLDVDHFPWFSKKIKKGSMVFVPRVKDLPDEAESEREEWAGEGIQSLINLPMYYGGEIIGFIGFDAVRNEVKWSEDILSLLQIAGDMIAQVLERRTKEVKKLHDIEEMAVLNALSKVTNEANTVDELIQGAVKIIGDTVYSDIFGIGVMIDEGQRVKGYFSDRDGKPSWKEFDSDVGIVGRMIREKRPVLVDDIRKDPDFIEIASGTRSQLCVPILSESKVIGTINAERKELSGFKARDEELLLVLAGQLGVALEKLHLFEQVKELAARDSLTGLYNRRHFYELGHKEFSRARRYDTDLSAVMLDFDQFKAVNDQYGHAAGDQVLKEFAEVLAANMRASDIAGRYGGDEFAILLPGSDLESTCKFAKRLSKKVKQRGNEILEGKVKVTICLGLAEIDAGCVDVAMLLDRADQALLKAKQEEDGGLSVWGD